LCYSNISSIWHKEIIHQRKKNTSKEYLDLGEEEKICKNNKNLYFYCILETDPFARKHIFIREKKHKKIFKSGRRRKDWREEQKLLPLLCSSIVHPSYRKHLFIREKEHKKIFRSGEEKISKKNKKTSTFIVLLESSSIC